MNLLWKAAYQFDRITSMTNKKSRMREIAFVSIGLMIAFLWVLGIVQDPEANRSGAALAFAIALVLIGLGLFWRHVRRQSGFNPHYLSEKARG